MRSDSPQSPSSLQDRLVGVSDFTTKARSTVARDRNGVLQYHPRPEVGTRLGKELGKLLIGLAMVRGKGAPDDEDFRVVERVAEDCLPPNRLLVINALREGPKRMAEIERSANLPHKTTDRVLDDLRVLGIVESDEKSALWSLVSE